MNRDFIIKDKRGNEIYHEYSNARWYKTEFDEYGNETYYENSGGFIKDERPKESRDKVVEVDGIKYKLTKI